MSTNHSGKKSESDDTCTIFMFQAFIIDQGDLFLKYGLKKFLIIWLFFTGMREEEIGFVGNQVLRRHFFYTQQDITVRDIISYFHSGHRVFTVAEATMR